MENWWASEEDARRTLARDRVIRNRTDILDYYDDSRLIKDFRFPRQTILHIVDMCHHLQRNTVHPNALPVHIQVLATLRFLARGTFQDDVKDIVGLSQSSVSRVLTDVCDAISSRANDYIIFPNAEEQRKIKIKFYQKYGFPNVIGLIDGSHIFIKSPSEEMESMFVCRKGGHSINVQFVTDPDMIITDIVIKWPGSTHDSYIWSTCGLRRKLSEINQNGWLLGDSGYPCEPWLLTPFESQPTQSHIKFNEALSRTRSQIERTIGFFKSVFRRFDKSGGILLYEPNKVCKFLLAAAILHNTRRKLNLPEDEAFEMEDLIEQDESLDGMTATQITTIGNEFRNEIRENFFTH